MKKTLSTLSALILAAAPAFAGGSYSGGYLVFKGAAMLFGVFLCSVIFWWVYLWMVVDKGVLKKTAVATASAAPVAAKKPKRGRK